MKKIIFLIAVLIMSVMSCQTYTIYDEKVLGVVDEVYTVFHKPYKYEVFITTYEGGRKHYKLRTDTRYEIGDIINVQVIK